MPRAHGYGGHKELGLAPYAEAFASNGYACIVFDYRRWGGSGRRASSDLYIRQGNDLTVTSQMASPVLYFGSLNNFKITKPFSNGSVPNPNNTIQTEL